MAGQLQNIFNKSFAYNNLFEVSLVKDNTPELPFYKSRFFCFLSMSPGMENPQTGGRTYNNKDGKIAIKADYDKVLALAESLRFWAKGGGISFGKFSIFTDSSKSQYNNGQGQFKSLFISEYVPKDKNTQQPDPTNRKITISFKLGQNNPIGVMMTPSEALGIADILSFVGRKAMEEDYMTKSVQVGTVQSLPQQSSKPQEPVPPIGTISPNPFENTDDNPFSTTAASVADNFSSSMSSMAPPPISETPF